MRVGRGWRSTTGGLAAVLAAAGALGAGAPAASACAPVMATNDVASGMTGTGWTVVRGRTPEAFAVEVLGVLRNAIAPGRDVVLVEATSPAIERAGGAWFGMSGSPVFVDGKLVGAVALGLGSATGASTIVGLTPAEEMLRLLSYPSTRTTGTADSGDDGSVALPADVARELAARTGARVADVDTLTQLKVPFGVSGIDSDAIGYVRRFADARKLALAPYVASSKAVGTAASAAGRMEPGDNFAAVASVGDVTAAGIGTATYVCNGHALAFGHPMMFSGSTTLGATQADALTIVPDRPWGSYKLATIGDFVGRVDEDRLAGLRAVLGPPPEATAIRTTVAAPGLGARRDGATDAVSPDWLSFVTFLHVMSSIGSTFDSIGEGTASLSWTIEGTRAGGAPWRLPRSNVYASRWEIASESAWELAGHLDLIVENPFEDVRVTGVRVEASVEETVRQYRVRRVLVSTNGERFRARRVVAGRPGASIRVRVVLAPFERGRNRRVDFAFRLPRRGAPVGVIEIAGRGGGGEGAFVEEECMIDDECGESRQRFRSFDALLRHLARAPRNDVLTAKLRLGERMRVKQKRARTLPGVVTGWAQVRIRPGREGGRPGGGGEAVALEGERP